MVGDYNDETNFLHQLFLTKTQVSRLCKAFVKTQLFKMVQLGDLLGRLLGPLLKFGLPLMANILKPLVKSVLIPLGLTAAVSATDVGIQKKTFRSWRATLIFLNEELDDIIKIVKLLGVIETMQNEVKNKKDDFKVCYIMCVNRLKSNKSR